MKNTLHVTAVFAGLLALSQTVQAHDAAPTEAIRTQHTTLASQPVAEQPIMLDGGHLQLAVVSSPAPAKPVASTDEDGMPSVAIGLGGLLLMLCALVRRRSESPVL